MLVGSGSRTNSGAVLTYKPDYSSLTVGQVNMNLLHLPHSLLDYPLLHMVYFTALWSYSHLEEQCHSTCTHHAGYNFQVRYFVVLNAIV